MTLDVGLIGAGRIGHKTHAALLHARDGTSLQYVADVDGARAETVADRFSTNPITVTDPSDLPRTDAVVLAIPVGVRDPYFREFEDRNVAIFSEKPFAPTTKQHRVWNSVSDQVTCNYIRLEYGPTEQIRSLIEGDALGELRTVTYRKHFFGPTGISPDSYEMDPDLAGGGLLMEYGVHLLAEIHSLFGPDSLRVGKSEVQFSDGLDIETRLHLEASTGSTTVPIDLHLSWNHPEAHIARYEFEGGTVTWDLRTPEATLVLDNADPPLRLEPWDGYPSTNKEAVARRLDRFVTRVQAGESFDDTRPEITRLIEETYRDEGVQA